MPPTGIHALTTTLALMLACIVTGDARAADEEETFERIAVIGASASAGFGVIEEITLADGSTRIEGVSIGDILVAAETEDDLVVLDLASGGFFMRPLALGSSCVERVRSWEPDLVVAIDFLFWFVYGSAGRTEDMPEGVHPRLARLEQGLDLLAQLETPLIIGEIPDMSAAIGGMLRRSQVPTRATMDAANRRIHDWAKARPGTAVVPLFELTSNLGSGKSFLVGDTTWNPTEDEIALVLPDKLHPTLEGLIALLQSADFEADRTSGMTGRMPELVLDRASLTERIRRPEGTGAEAEPAATSAAP
ncbi:MAG: hypothetical protein MK082_02220 [Phycisphaerales bacterium]|nr:hypothetical protein [Phycisphaerales bacterium]